MQHTYDIMLPDMSKYVLNGSRYRSFLLFKNKFITYLLKDILMSSYILQKYIWVIDQILDFRAAQYVKSQMSKMSNVCFMPNFLPIPGPNKLFMV